MVNVCCNYNGSIMLLESFETKEDAAEFMQHDCILVAADELENGEDDIVIHTCEMFIEDELPFFEKIEDYMDELPF